MVRHRALEVGFMSPQTATPTCAALCARRRAHGLLDSCPLPHPALPPPPTPLSLPSARGDPRLFEDRLRIRKIPVSRRLLGCFRRPQSTTARGDSFEEPHGSRENAVTGNRDTGVEALLVVGAAPA